MSPAGLGAFSGLSYARRGAQVWIDRMRGPVHPMVEGLDLSRAQAVALGWHRASVETLAAEGVH